jgi:nucleotide-binding universal stress UspA family protein
MSMNVSAYKMRGATRTSGFSTDELQSRARPLVWAVDPFEHDSTRLRPVVRAMKLWRGSSRAKVLPVAVMTPYDFGWAPELFPILLDGSTPPVTRHLKAYLAGLGMKGLQPPKLIYEPTTSRRQGPEVVKRFAADHDAELIVVATHGRRGFQRLRMGSFAETLLALSSTPVMVINPKVTAGKKISSIFLPMEFSDDTMHTLKYVLNWAKRFQAKIQLYHLMDSPPSAAYFYREGTDPEVILRAVENARSVCRSKGATLAAGIRKQGIECEFFLESRATPIGKAIVRNAKNLHSDLVVLTASRGPLGQAFFGGSIREVLCTALTPVVVVHAR